MPFFTFNQTKYRNTYNDFSQRFNDIKARLDLVKVQIADKTTWRALIRDFLNELRPLNELVTKYGRVIFRRLVDYYMACSKEDVLVAFKNETEIKA